MPSGEPKALVPRDIRGLRQQQIGYLQHPDSFLRTLGGLGSPQSPLQMQGADALGAMLRQPTPEQRSLDVAFPALQAMLTGTGPQFEQDIALANQQGGRFGSANAVLRGEALRNLYNLRNQTAGTLGLLGSSAGQANRGLAGQAFGMGQQQAMQGDLETQRRLQVLMQLLGVGQQTAFNVPIQQGGSGWGQLLGGLGGMLLGGPFGSALGGWAGNKLFGGGGGAATYPYAPLDFSGPGSAGGMPQ